MKYINPARLKLLMGMFYVTGSVGIFMGLQVAPPSSTLFITFMGVINIGLGALFTFVYLSQGNREPDKRKKKKDRG